MRKVANWVAVAVIFLGTLVIVLERYQEERTIVVEQGMHPFATAIVSFLVIAFVMFMIANFKALIIKNPFGTFAVLMYGTIVASFTGLGILWVRNIQNAAAGNFDAFMANMDYHADTMLGILAVTVVGLAIALSVPSVELVNKLRK